MAKLTKRTVDEAEIKATEYFIWCDELPGFGVRIYPSGRRGYLVQYRSGGRSRRAKIGLHGHLTADEARKEARALLGLVAKGGDPAQERETQRNSMTVAQLCARYLVAAEKGLVMGKGGRPKKPLTLYSDKGRIERHIVPLLGKRLVRDLTQADVARLIRDITTGKAAVVEKTKKRGKAVAAHLRPYTPTWGARALASSKTMPSATWRKRRSLPSKSRLPGRSARRAPPRSTAFAPRPSRSSCAT